jgi:hypothetical protein
MEHIDIKVSKTPPGSKCARLGCGDVGVHRINELHDGKWDTACQDFCEIHFAEFMNNGLLRVVQDA